MRRVLSLILVVGMLISLVPIQSNGTTEASGKKEKYIVRGESKSDFSNIKNDLAKDGDVYINHAKKDEKYLNDTSSVVAELTENEAEKLKNTNNVTIEKDYTLKGSSLGEVEVDNKESTNLNISSKNWDENINVDKKAVKAPEIEKKGEYTDTPELFKPCKEVKDKKKSDETVPWNVACVAGTPSKNKFRGEGVKVALIDSGIDTHNELNTAEWVDFSDKVDGYKTVDNNGHGTAMAGVIAARINGIGFEGIASSSKLYSVKVFNKDNEASVSSVIKAIEWCIENDIDTYYADPLVEIFNGSM